MLKKVVMSSLLALVAGSTICLTGCSCDSEKEDSKTEERAAIPTFDTPEALIEYSLNAQLNQDARAMLHTLSPEQLQLGIETFGSREKLEDAFQAYLNLKASDSEQLREMLNDPARKDQIIRSIVESSNGQIIQIDGKWYMHGNSGDFSDIAKSYVTTQFVEAVLDRNTDALWELLSPETQERLNRDANGNQQTLKHNLTRLCQGIIRDNDIRNARNNKMAYIARQLEFFSQTGSDGSRILTEVDGKYFINLLPLMR